MTNACDSESLFANIIKNPKFLYSALYTFDNQAVIRFFESSGCRIKIERGERVFPATDHSSDVISALNREMSRHGVSVRLNHCVKEIKVQEGNVEGVVLKDGSLVKADVVVLAAGGASYPSTGSDGVGYKMARAAGHTIKDPAPALVPLEISEKWCGQLMGLSLKNISLTMIGEGKKPLFEGFGEMLFTHFGVSGPLVLSASSYYPWGKEKQDVKLILDLKPALADEQLDKRLLRDFQENKNKSFKNALDDLFPQKLIPVMIDLSGIDPDKKVHEVTKQERQAFVSGIKNVVLHVTGTRGFAEAVITRGGVSVKEVNPSTMESKLVKGLYFAGEILDVDALTGGFNLQIAWSTGYLAGESV